MGYIKHSAIIVTGTEEGVATIHNKAVEIFHLAFGATGASLVSPIIKSVINGYHSFFIAPDGSNEGWEDSRRGDDARGQLLDCIEKEEGNYCDFVQINFGGDDDNDKITRSRTTQEEI